MHFLASSESLKLKAAHYIGLNGAVMTSPVARQLMSSYLNGEWSIADSDGQSVGLRGLPFETKVNLFCSIAGASHDDNPEYLFNINRELGLTRWVVEDTAYYKSAKLAVDLLFATQQSLGSVALADHFMLMRHETSAVKNDVVQDTFRHFAQIYAKTRGISDVSVQYYSADDGLVGKAYENNIGINTTSFVYMNDPFVLVDTVCHEVEHLVQKRLHSFVASDQCGNVVDEQTSVSTSLLGKLFDANLSTPQGYIPVENSLGFTAYRGQPVEIFAHDIGEYAQSVADKVFDCDAVAGPRRSEPAARSARNLTLG